MNNNTANIILIGFGLFLILGSTALVVTVSCKMRAKSGVTSYDERQTAARGQAYKYAFWVLVAYMSVNALYIALSGSVWADITVQTFFGVLLAIGVLAVILIIKDAYVALTQSPKSTITVLSIVTVSNLAIGICKLLDGSELITDGALNYRVINLACGVFGAAVLIAYLIKLYTDKKNAEND